MTTCELAGLIGSACGILSILLTFTVLIRQRNQIKRLLHERNHGWGKP